MNVVLYYLLCSTTHNRHQIIFRWCYTLSSNKLNAHHSPATHSATNSVPTILQLHTLKQTQYPPFSSYILNKLSTHHSPATYSTSSVPTILQLHTLKQTQCPPFSSYTLNKLSTHHSPATHSATTDLVPTILQLHTQQQAQYPPFSSTKFYYRKSLLLFLLLSSLEKPIIVLCVHIYYTYYQ